jgi:hypothetical protein
MPTFVNAYVVGKAGIDDRKGRAVAQATLET